MFVDCQIRPTRHIIPMRSLGYRYIGFILGLAGSVMNSCLGHNMYWMYILAQDQNGLVRSKHKDCVFVIPGVSWLSGVPWIWWESPAYQVPPDHGCRCSWAGSFESSSLAHWEWYRIYSRLRFLVHELRRSVARSWPGGSKCLGNCKKNIGTWYSWTCSADFRGRESRTSGSYSSAFPVFAD